MTLDPVLARQIRLVGFDVDGVLTDGGIYLGDVDGTRHEFKRYDIQDGIGMVLLRKVGIKVAIVTGRVSESVRMRAAELAVDDLFQDPDAMKLRGFKALLERHQVRPDHAAFVGDDFPDYSILQMVGLPVAVGNAAQEVRDLAKVTLSATGGRGAVREFCEILLKARGEWESAYLSYVREKSEEKPA